MIRICFSLFALWIFGGSLSAQTTTCHLDRPFYFPGQNLHYAFFSDLLVRDSCLIGVQFYAGQEEVSMHYALIKEGHGEGYFPLSFDVSPGEYFLQFTAFEAKDGDPLVLLTTPVTVLTDGELLDSNFKIAIFAEDHFKDEIGIQVNKTISKRERMDIIVTVPSGKEGDIVSIAIRDKELYPVGTTIRVNPLTGSEDSRSNFLDFIPMTGERKILSNEINDKAFLFVCNPEDVQFRFNWVNPDGSFFIKMTPFYGEKDLYFIDNGKNSIDVSLTDKLPLVKQQVKYSTSQLLVPIVEANRTRKKIYQLFSNVEESINEDASSRSQNIPEPDMNIDVQDFSVRGKLVDLLKEIITPFKFRKENDGRYTIKVLYQLFDLKYFYDSDPVFIVNGMVTRDFNFIANLPLQDIKRLKIYADLKTLRDLKLVDVGGVGIVEMVDPLFALSENQRLPHRLVQGLQRPINYPVESNIQSKNPLLKSLLFWMPNASLDSAGQYHFSVPVSDDISTFEIEVLHPQLGLTGRQDFKVRM
ncbi:MAG: hypothetical protein KDC53_17625 [Saprospiraceae bacterium]|nr:hypothetical protein [Saprospiraceae bacterium]